MEGTFFLLVIFLTATRLILLSCEESSGAAVATYLNTRLRRQRRETRIKQQRQEHPPRMLLPLPLLSQFKDPKTVISKIVPPDLHVVYFFLDPTDKKSSYNVNHEMLEAIIVHNFRALAPAWQTHVITSNDNIIQKLTSEIAAVAKGNTNNNISHLSVVDYRKIPRSKRVERFKNTYVSQSFNDVEYESFCMYRWIVISEYFDRLVKEFKIPVKIILGLDTDIVLVDDPLLTVGEMVDWKVTQSYRIINGAAMLWTPAGLENFVTFLLDVYAPPKPPQKAIELSKKHGTVHPECYESGSLLIPCFTPPEDETTRKVMLHISDMVWYVAWSREDLSIRLSRPDPQSIPCYVISHLDEDQPFRFVRLGSDHLLGSPENEEQTLKRVCFVHFQGETKDAIFSFLRFLEGDTHEYFLPPRP